jgi:2-hydroxychromene-2-carboxylate isomerase
MTRTIDYYFTLPSPWTYLGHQLFLAICARHGAAIRYRPMPIGDVFDATGSLPLPKRPPARQRYRFVEMQRWRDKRGLPLVLKPKHFPFDPTLLNRAIAGLGEQGRDPGALVGAALAALWAEDRDLGDETEAGRLIAAAGFDPAETLALARSDAAAEAYARNGRDAVAADVFGAPGYVLDGEVFWGQDRLELLDDALASARGPYRPV